MHRQETFVLASARQCSSQKGHRLHFAELQLDQPQPEQ
jgi:hypothetical protein